jgi:hypothetical protein
MTHPKKWFGIEIAARMKVTRRIKTHLRLIHSRFVTSW